MDRLISAEWLDNLPADDVRARRSRADLRRLNAIIGHGRILARLWRSTGLPHNIEHAVELGAGDGTFCLKLMRRLAPRWRIQRMTLVDRAASVSRQTIEEFARVGCAAESRTADVFDWLNSETDATVIFANLFLHHFREQELRTMFELAAQNSRFFFAVEPRRTGLSLAGSRLLGLIGCNDVTRHDAVASVRAGFGGHELSGLWPERDGWILHERSAGLFSHAFAAGQRGRKTHTSRR